MKIILAYYVPDWALQALSQRLGYFRGRRPATVAEVKLFLDAAVENAWAELREEVPARPADIWPVPDEAPTT